MSARPHFNRSVCKFLVLVLARALGTLTQEQSGELMGNDKCIINVQSRCLRSSARFVCSGRTGVAGAPFATIDRSGTDMFASRRHSTDGNLKL